ncbi:uncharacterized protein LOC141718437 [Apium graveolens]|uniref:uncharacterized protein LOC141718437 n=1 Tax=Apium graveolens TaxID=4045 RepID=UPI003D7B379D
MTFSTEDYEDVISPYEDPLIINPIIGQNKIWKVMVDTGSSANILFHKTYCKMNLAGEQLEPCNEAPLYAIGGHPIQFEETITLPVLLGKLPYTAEKLVKFYVVRIESPPEDMPGLDPKTATHCSNVQPEAKPVKQKKRTFAVERQKVIEAEVEKLLEARFIEEIEYPDWLANVVVVKKSNGKWRMCVDYTDLNKACPKDHYPLPNID